MGDKIGVHSWFHKCPFIHFGETRIQVKIYKTQSKDFMVKA